jgi:tetratricopeptide (TPR) repeat protein
MLSALSFIYRVGSAKKFSSRYARMRTKNINTYLKQNEEKVLDSCMSANESVRYYRNIYLILINTIYDLEVEGFLRKRERIRLFSLLRNGAIHDLQEKIRSVNLVRLNDHSLSKRYLMMAMVSDIGFSEFHLTENLYRGAIENDRFDLQNHFMLANFYRRNCRYDEAIGTLLTISSVASNSSQRINLSENYKMLADLYMAKRDYENALANYVNSLVILDFKDKDRDKTQVLVSLGDIMMIRGNSLEAINYYKYALSIGKLKSKAYIGLLLKLSDAYYNYGNYVNGLKFATMATSRARKINNRFLYSKSKYLECLNYEYLGEGGKARDSCAVAVDEGEKHREEFPNYQSYLHLAEMLDFSSHTRNPELAIQYLETANSSIGNDRDIYRKISVLERLASIRAYSGGQSDELAHAVSIYRNLDKIYRDNDIGIGCCNTLISGFLMERSGTKNAEETYLKAERELKNRKKQLAVLYSYMSDFYGKTNRKRQALFYAKKALEIDSQIYRFDHHYIKYALDRVTQLLKKQEE